MVLPSDGAQAALERPISSARPLTPPASRSLWPPQYLVSEVMQRSAPQRERAAAAAGPRKVLSTATSGRQPCRSADLVGDLRRPGRCRRPRRSGLAGVSSQISRSGPAAIAASAAARIAAAVEAVGEVEGLDPEAGQHRVQQAVGAAVDRPARAARCRRAAGCAISSVEIAAMPLQKPAAVLGAVEGGEPRSTMSRLGWPSRV